MNYEYKISCVVDAENYYVTVVKVDLMPVVKANQGTPLDTEAALMETEWVAYCYTLQDGERIVDAPPPFPPTYAGEEGFVRPKWEDAASAWIEGATEEEIAAWEGEHPDPKTLDDVRKETLMTLSNACNTAIVSGCNVALSDGSIGHFSLLETDQINLTAAVAAVEQGATSYPYHADGQLCKSFPAADILRIATAATAHKLYHTTYCNHLNVWARRVETRDELGNIVYGAELPADLAANMEGVLHNAGMQSDM